MNRLIAAVMRFPTSRALFCRETSTCCVTSMVLRWVRPRTGRASMPSSSAAQRPLEPLTQAPGYPDDLLSKLQTTLAALADVEVRYEIDRKQLEGWIGPEAIKKRFTAQLGERHQRDREPYVQQLANLHYEIMTLMALQDICSTA
jgi:hypothetical protein